MTSKLTIVIALFAGLAGGMLTRFVTPAPVFAQTPATAPSELRARSFALVDPSDHTVGTFTTDGRAGGMRIVLRDANGREIWSAGGSPIRPLAASPH
jgi:hypothetical protein